ncbi:MULTISPECIES: rubredoxin [Methanobacterium]|jgi:rubredoxin|uniref:Rubredoxin n=1 Tax=Methanobacterium bryantii TaxID=2161 RepID=A0A2A2H132_METBR|nr:MULTISPECIES: rubredoxin [Methanobacterium]OEC86394.1 hypothetical protein A9507_00480 [Methanobacterium sp. A39]PAV03055.1 hypothetical protein ASJ80_07225 [Methanobacterium bryantii]
MVYKCDVCNYICDPNNGDPENGIKAGTDLKNLPSNWVCPICGIEKDYFYLLKNEDTCYPERSRILSMANHVFAH